MSVTEIIFIGIGLAMDCFAVSITSTICYPDAKLRRYLLMALCFGLFQGMMPIAGWLLGLGFAELISAIDHWLALVILGAIGVKMIWESLKKEDASQAGNCKKLSPFTSIKVLLLLSVATSIDALVTGLIFVGHKDTIMIAAIIITLCSLIFTMAGIWIGRKFGQRFKINVEMIGGLILIAIGIKIVVEHTELFCF